MVCDAPRSPAPFGHAPWRHLLGRTAGPARAVPTMLSSEERQLYFWLTALWARGCGDIVDLGCFAGGSTARLAQGHVAARLGSRIHAFDRFTADESTKRRVLYPAGIPPFRGNDILPLARRLLAPWAGRIEFHPGEIEDCGWTGAAIEIVTCDAAKSASDADDIASIFFPHLVPGRSVVVQQDQMLWNQPWITAQMQLLAEYFTPVAIVPDSTVIHLCRSAPDRAALAAARTARLDDAALTDLLQQARKTLSPLGGDAALDRMIAAIQANPGERHAWNFERP